MHGVTNDVSASVPGLHVNQRTDVKHGDDLHDGTGDVGVQIVQGRLDVCHVLLRIVAFLGS